MRGSVQEEEYFVNILNKRINQLIAEKNEVLSFLFYENLFTQEP